MMTDKLMIEKSTTELINEIYNRPGLWDRGSPHYNRLTTDTQWDEISVITGLSKERAKQKWKRLRDIYRKELKKIIAIEERDGRAPDQPRWVHFTSMDFLRPTLSGDLKNGGSVAKKEPSLSDCSDDETKIQQEGGGHHDHEPSTSVYSDHIRHPRENSLWSHQSLMEPTVEISTSGGGGGGGAGRASRPDDDDRTFMLRLGKRALSDEHDDDLHFLKSLAPYLKMFSPVKKLRVRNNIQLALLAELDENADA